MDHDDTIMAVVASWCSRLPDQLTNLCALVEALAPGAADDAERAHAARLDAHRLVGTSYTLGFPWLGAALGELENELITYEGASVDAQREQATIIAGALAVVRDAAKTCTLDRSRLAG